MFCFLFIYFYDNQRKLSLTFLQGCEISGTFGSGVPQSDVSVRAARGQTSTQGRVGDAVKHFTARLWEGQQPVSLSNVAEKSLASFCLCTVIVSHQRCLQSSSLDIPHTDGVIPGCTANLLTVAPEDGGHCLIVARQRHQGSLCQCDNIKTSNSLPLTCFSHFKYKTESKAS